MSDKKRKRIRTAIALFCILALAIVWLATKDLLHCIQSINEEISNYRSPRSSFYFEIPESLRGNAKFEKFLLTQAQEMCQNNEWAMLSGFLVHIMYEDYQTTAISKALSDRFLPEYCQARDLRNISELLSILKDLDYTSPSNAEMITDYFSSAETLEEALEIKDRLEPHGYSLPLNRNSDLIASYIEANGTNPVTKKPRRGYYADKKDGSSKHTIGLPNSPIYDAKSYTYKGDFKIVKEWGVELNIWYEETSYSRKDKYYFRDQQINFSPDDGDCVWSGDYLFCFSDNGDLIAYDTVK